MVNGWQVLVSVIIHLHEPALQQCAPLFVGMYCRKDSNRYVVAMLPGAEGRVLLFSISPPTSPPIFIRSFEVPTPPKAISSKSGVTPHINAGPVGGPGINDITFSPDSKTIACASDDKLVRIWKRDQPNPENIGILNAESGNTVNGANPARATLNGSAVAKTMNGRNASSNDVKTLRGHTSFVHSVAYSPQGNLLASGSYDETIRIWDVKRGNLITVIVFLTAWLINISVR